MSEKMLAVKAGFVEADDGLRVARNLYYQPDNQWHATHFLHIHPEVTAENVINTFSSKLEQGF